MKNLFRIAILMILSIPGISQDCKDLPKLSMPAMAVNDFANVISDDVQEDIEATLRNYLSSTTIPLSVAMVESLNGYTIDQYAPALFNCWGVGNKSNNGVLLVFSMAEHKIMIVPGDGIEGSLTDLKSQEIIDIYITPECKKGDYSNAVKMGVEKIIEHLGTMSWGARQTMLRAEKEANEKEAREFKDSIIQYALLALFVFLVACLIRVIHLGIQRNKKWKALVARSKKYKQHISELTNRSKAILEIYDERPKWIQQECLTVYNTVGKLLTNANGYLAQFHAHTKASIKEAEAAVNNAGRSIGDIVEEVEFLSHRLPEKIEMMTKETPILLKDAHKTIDQHILAVQARIDEGYCFEDALQGMNRVKTALSEYDQKVPDVENIGLIYYESKKLIEGSTIKMNEMVNMIENQKTVNVEVPKMVASMNECAGKMSQAQKMIEEYKTKYLVGVWYPVSQLIDVWFKYFVPANIEKIVSNILSLNNMENQQFAIAARKFNEARIEIQKANDAYASTLAVEAEQKKSREAFNKLSIVAKSEMEIAVILCTNNDVKSATKELLEKAKVKLSDVVNSSKESLIDWVTLLLSLRACITDIKSVVTAANSDIAKAKRKRDDAAAEAKQKNISITNAVRTSTTSRTSYGGYGGGRTSGGGASGSW